MLNWALVGILTLLQVLDFLTTKRIIAKGGRETSQPMLKVMSWLGETKAMIVMKSIAVIAAVIAAYILNNDIRLTIGLLAISAVYIVVIANNFKVLSNLND